MNENLQDFASLAGMRVVVTGASSGIGKEIALECARAGANIVVHYAQSKEAAQAVVDECEAMGVQAQSVQADFLQSGCDPLAESIWNESGPIDIWVNNAGVDLLTGAGAKLDFSEKLEKLLAVDVSACVHLSRKVGRLMQKRGRGTILNIGWDQADRGMEGESAELFSTAKNAVMGFTRSLAVSLAPEVRVNCIAPGWIQTEWGDQASSEWQSRVLQETPLKRWGKPTDIAKLARFLISSEAAYLTGQVINANGGAVR
ncbi:SDR family oxidoreductase [Planctomicrobium sp.]|jgi:3-oxoacyl-[acyl-carrier protein] reductase|nr:SDR family oxidoreductase [Planctomicrobium sp.]MBT5017939.1 SDR family oxidoreductase [Planctomicrobium sp.]MDB4731657.1 SDR family oxidoreductase [bacterium]MDB4743340.1 SDR family oxidoreductase [Planctomicrobium sp.]MDB4802364.1 SDR family oxidoreductase [bacterium]